MANELKSSHGSILLYVGAITFIMTYIRVLQIYVYAH